MNYGAVGAGAATTGAASTLAFTGPSFIGISLVIGVAMVLVGALMYRYGTRSKKYAP